MSCSNSFSFSKSAADGEVVASYQLKICLDDIIGKCTVLYWNSKKEIYFHPDDAAICMYSDWLDTLFAGNIEHSSHLKTSSICKHTHNIPCIRTFISALIKTANRSCTIKVIRSIPMILTTAIKKYKLNIQHSSSIENSMYFTQSHHCQSKHLSRELKWLCIELEQKLPTLINCLKFNQKLINKISNSICCLLGYSAIV